MKLGLSHVPLANAALDALEDWSSNIPLETMQPCYSSILPLLDGYLKVHLNQSKQIVGIVTHTSIFFFLLPTNIYLNLINPRPEANEKKKRILSDFRQR